MGDATNRLAPALRALGAVCGVAALALFHGGCTAVATSTPSVTAFSTGARVLFQGDSITDGNRGRSEDPNHILGHGYQYLVAARYGADYPERGLVFLNRGISGNRLTNLQARWETDTIALKPDVLSILIGVNDLNFGVSAADYERQYDELLAATRQALPQVKLVLCEPFGLPTGPKKATWDKYHSALLERQAIVARLAKKYDAALVRFQAALDAAVTHAPAEYWIWDGVHPTYSGHGLMAEEWVRAVRERWPDGL